MDKNGYQKANGSFNYFYSHFMINFTKATLLFSTAIFFSCTTTKKIDLEKASSDSNPKNYIVIISDESVSGYIELKQDPNVLFEINGKGMHLRYEELALTKKISIVGDSVIIDGRVVPKNRVCSVKEKKLSLVKTAAIALPCAYASLLILVYSFLGAYTLFGGDIESL